MHMRLGHHMFARTIQLSLYSHHACIMSLRLVSALTSVHGSLAYLSACASSWSLKNPGLKK